MMLKHKIGLTNNQLKIIAMVTMLIDHIGAYLFPQYILLRIIGRMSFPIFAYMIAEGCRHTRNRARYLLTVLAVATVCQAVYFVVTGSMYSNILITFSLSIGTIYCLDNFVKKKDLLSGLIAFAALCVVGFLCVILPKLDLADFWISYGLFGTLMPVAIYFAPNKPFKLVAAALLMLALSIQNDVQWYAFLALPLLALYNEERGKLKLKYVFYIFYPAHLGILFLIKLLIERL